MGIRAMNLRFSFRIGTILCAVLLFGMAFGLLCFHHPLLAMLSENDSYIWDIRTSQYMIDGSDTICFTDGGEDENWMKDEKGENVAFWMGGGGGAWGVGSGTMGGSKGGRDEPTPLPHAVRLSYYDYGDGKFYRLDAVLPTEKIRQLMRQKVFNPQGWDSKYHKYRPDIEQRYDTIEYAIGPRGYIVFWASKYGVNFEQVELGRYWAKERPDMTVAKWNDNEGKGRSFKISERWAWIKRCVTPKTLARLKEGWSTTPDYYINTGIEYPWRVTMTGNATLMSYQLYLANREIFHIYPWELPKTVSDPLWQTLPGTMVLFFVDKQGKWHRLRFDLYAHDRFGGHNFAEPDLTPIAAAFKEIFPNITLDTKPEGVAKADFAQVEVHMSDDLKSFDVYLVKGNKRIELPVGQDSIDFSDIAPYASRKGLTPTPAEVEWNKYGPDGHP